MHRPLMKGARPFARVFLLSFLLHLASASQARAQPPTQTPAPLSAEKIKEIEAAITSEMSKQGIPGLSVAVSAGGRLNWSNGYGMADVENSVPARAGTVYRLGSISKTITAVAVMQLAEGGRLDLDAPVQKYCPAFPQKQWPVTARQILGHLSGIRHYKSEEEFNSTRRYESIVEGLSMFKDDPLLHEPGTKYTYTTFGYTVLGCAVEGAVGEKFADYVRAHVLKPAGMERMRVDSIAEIIPHRAQGYRRDPKTNELRNSPLADNSYKIPGGGFVSTVEDLAKFAAAFSANTLVKAETAEQMFMRQKTRDGKETNYGLGFGVGTWKGQRMVGHSGAQQRVSTFLHMLPERGVAVVLMVNLEDAELGDLAIRIADIVLK
ncbi:MAG: beta-lactamase family protein [Acidobacteria bacterium]|nr:beta-lactamase family protein [Acidobacteriota bacterium]